jgi:hypothetical protein
MYHAMIRSDRKHTPRYKSDLGKKGGISKASATTKPKKNKGQQKLEQRPKTSDKVSKNQSQLNYQVRLQQEHQKREGGAARLCCPREKIENGGSRIGLSQSEFQAGDYAVSMKPIADQVKVLHLSECRSSRPLLDHTRLARLVQLGRVSIGKVAC